MREKSGLVRNIGVGQTPDVAVSPDGSRLYIGGDALTIVAADTGKTLGTTPNPGHPLWPGPIPTSLMVISPDGSRLYMLKRKTVSGRDVTWVASFDAARQAFDTASAQIDDCPAASLHAPSADQVFVVCGGENTVYAITRHSDGQLVQSSRAMLDKPAGVLPTGEKNAHGDIRSVIWGRGAEAFLVKLDGQTLRFDTQGMRVTGSSAGPLTGMWVLGGEGAVSGDGRTLFVGCSRLHDTAFERQYIAAFDSQTLILIKIAHAPAAFRSLAWNPFAPELLLTSPDTHSVIALDPQTLQQTRMLSLNAAPDLIRFPSN